jgi:ribosome biogenesis ATPase
MPRSSLQNHLDREVLQVIHKFQEDRPDSELKAFLIYNYISKSNSSLKRRSRSQLEDSIERCLSVMAQEEPEPESRDRSRERAVSPNFMNRLVVGSWSAGGSAGNDGMVAEKDVQREPARENTSSRKRKRQRGAETPLVSVDSEGYNLSDIGGVDDVKAKLRKLLLLPLLRPDIYIRNNLDMPRGILLHGPPGCGKTTLARAFSSASGLPLIEILGPGVVSGMSGESEQNIRERFEEARRVAPAIIFIDEIDVLAPKRDQAGSQMEKRIVAQLLICMDDLAHHKNGGKPVIVIGATNRPDALDPSLRRGGRFNAEINMGVPNESMRESILRVKLRKIPHGDDVDFKALAKATAGYVGADLTDLVSQAGSWALDKYEEALLAQAASEDQNGHDNAMQVDNDNSIANPNDNESRTDRDITRLILLLRNSTSEPPGYDSSTPLLTMPAFHAALKVVQPSALREGFTTVPETTWSDVGALEDVRTKLITSIVDPIQNPLRYASIGIRRPGGVLLWGPPGCGKTLIAKAVANESKANFIAVKGPELLNKYVGESERAVRTVFDRARSSVPCVLFFDELDALAGRRDGGEDSSSAARVVGALLIELDGLGGREGIYVIGATNRRDMIDPAMLRSGRFGQQIFVGLPDGQGRASILRTLLRPVVATGTLDSQELEGILDLARNESRDGLSGADLEMLLNAAGTNCLHRNGTALELLDFETVIGEVKPSVKDYRRYLKMADLL